MGVQAPLVTQRCGRIGGHRDPLRKQRRQFVAPIDGSYRGRSIARGRLRASTDVAGGDGQAIAPIHAGNADGRPIDMFIDR
jgi:hypothetical protein